MQTVIKIQRNRNPSQQSNLLPMACEIITPTAFICDIRTADCDIGLEFTLRNPHSHEWSHFYSGSYRNYLNFYDFIVKIEMPPWPFLSEHSNLVLTGKRIKVNQLELMFGIVWYDGKSIGLAIVTQSCRFLSATYFGVNLLFVYININNMYFTWILRVGKDMSTL